MHTKVSIPSEDLQTQPQRQNQNMHWIQSFVPIVIFQTRSQWIGRMTKWQPCSKQLQFLKAKSITGKKKIQRDYVCLWVSSCALSPSLTTKDFESWQVWVTLETIHFIKTWAKNNASADDDRREWQDWRPNIHFVAWWRVNSEGGQGNFPTLPNGFWTKQGSVMESVGWWWCKRNLRRRGEKAPLKAGEEKIWRKP